MPQLLSEVQYGAFLAYSPKGPDTEPHRSSKILRTAMKEDKTYRGEPAIELAARRLREESPDALRELFPPGVVLVPAPGSAPLPRGLAIPLRGNEADFHWVPRRICEALVAEGVGGACAQLLSRITKVSRSSSARPADRPLPSIHLASLEILPQQVAAQDLLVVDDVVTRGSTLLACCSLLQSFYPKARVRGFALLRAVSNPAEFRAILDPVVGQITLRETGDTLRRP